MLKVGLLGAGRIGHVHATNIAGHPQSRLVAVSDVTASSAEKPSLKFLRKFHHVATDLFISDKGYPPERVFGPSE